MPLKTTKNVKIIGTKEAINRLLKDKVFNNCNIQIFIADKINFGTVYKGSTHNEIEKDKLTTKQKE